MELTESQIRRQIYEALEAAIRPYKGFIFAIETSGRSGRNNRLMQGYNQKGSSDLFMVLNGISVALEVKKPGGVQSEMQMEFEANIEAAGGHYYVVRSVVEALEIFRRLVNP